MAAAAATTATSISRHTFDSSVSVRRLSSAAPAASTSFNNYTTSQAPPRRARYHGGRNGPLTVVLKLEGSSLASAAKMRQAADIILSNRRENPVVALSAMANTAENLVIAGEKAVHSGVSSISNIPELNYVTDLHVRAVRELGLDFSVISRYLKELEIFLIRIAKTKKLPLRTQEYLVALGERMCTTIFAAHLNKMGARARRYNFSKATNLASVWNLHYAWEADPAIPVVTSFLGDALDERGRKSTHMTIGKALGLPEMELWRYVDGVDSKAPLHNLKSDTMPETYEADDSDDTSMSTDGRTSVHTRSPEISNTRRSDHRIPDRSPENVVADYEKYLMSTRGHQRIGLGNLHRESKKSRIVSARAHYPPNSHQPLPRPVHRPMHLPERSHHGDSTSSRSHSLQDVSKTSNNERGSSSRTANSCRGLTIGHNINYGPGNQKIEAVHCIYAESGYTEVRNVRRIKIGNMKVRAESKSHVHILNDLRL